MEIFRRDSYSTNLYELRETTMLQVQYRPTAFLVWATLIEIGFASMNLYFYHNKSVRIFAITLKFFFDMLEGYN